MRRRATLVAVSGTCFVTIKTAFDPTEPSARDFYNTPSRGARTLTRSREFPQNSRGIWGPGAAPKSLLEFALRMPAEPAALPADAAFNSEFDAWEQSEKDAAGVRHGSCRLYRSDGSLKLECRFTAGVLSGPFTAYHPKGARRAARQLPGREARRHGREFRE